jgi:hypothetical protein
MRILGTVEFSTDVKCLFSDRTNCYIRGCSFIEPGGSISPLPALTAADDDLDGAAPILDSCQPITVS